MADSMKVAKMATAVATAEGFFDSGSSPNLPQRCHNPGDLEIGSVGFGVDNEKTIFKDDNSGWMFLRHQCDLVLSGLSHAGYRLSDNWWQVAARWTGNDGAAGWAQTVAQKLGMSVTTTLQDYLDKGD